MVKGPGHSGVATRLLWPVKIRSVAKHVRTHGVLQQLGRRGVVEVKAVLEVALVVDIDFGVASLFLLLWWLIKPGTMLYGIVRDEGSPLLSKYIGDGTYERAGCTHDIVNHHL